MAPASRSVCRPYFLENFNVQDPPKKIAPERVSFCTHFGVILEEKAQPICRGKEIRLESGRVSRVMLLVRPELLVTLSTIRKRLAARTPLQPRTYSLREPSARFGVQRAVQRVLIVPRLQNDMYLSSIAVDSFRLSHLTCLPGQDSTNHELTRLAPLLLFNYSAVAPVPSVSVFAAATSSPAPWLAWETAIQTASADPKTKFPADERRSHKTGR